jgi:hypothetical protein
MEYRRQEGTGGTTLAAKYQPMMANLNHWGTDIDSEDTARQFVEYLRTRQSPTIANQNREFQLYNGIMLSVVKIDYVKCQKPALNADTKTSSSMDSFSRNRDINAKAVTINSPPPIESVVSPNG